MSDDLYRDHGIGLLIRLLALADALAAAVHEASHERNAGSVRMLPPVWDGIRQAAKDYRQARQP